MPDRRIVTNVPDQEVVNNKIETTHSNFLTFVPINLLTQLAKPVNGNYRYIQFTLLLWLFYKWYLPSLTLIENL